MILASIDRVMGKIHPKREGQSQRHCCSRSEHGIAVHSQFCFKPLMMIIRQLWLEFHLAPRMASSNWNTSPVRWNPILVMRNSFEYGHYFFLYGTVLDHRKLMTAIVTKRKRRGMEKKLRWPSFYKNLSNNKTEKNHLMWNMPNYA